jgi:hypothetical protein
VPLIILNRPSNTALEPAAFSMVLLVCQSVARRLSAKPLGLNSDYLARLNDLDRPQCFGDQWQ